MSVVCFSALLSAMFCSACERSPAAAAAADSFLPLCISVGRRFDVELCALLSTIGFTVLWSSCLACLALHCFVSSAFFCFDSLCLTQQLFFVLLCDMCHYHDQAQLAQRVQLPLALAPGAKQARWEKQGLGTSMCPRGETGARPIHTNNKIKLPQLQQPTNN